MERIVSAQTLLRVTSPRKSNTLPAMSDTQTLSHSETPVSQHAYRKASASVRITLLVYVLLVIYSSGFPFSGWRDNGLLPWSYLVDPMPHYWTWFDLVVNVIGYVPLGSLSVLALYPRVRGVWAVLITSASGMLLAVMLEGLQSYLPSRVPSNLDLMTNSLGVILGALSGTLLYSPVLEKSGLRSLRRTWFSEQASRGLIVVALWPVAQIYPQPYLFGHGQILPTVSSWLSSWFAMPVDLSQLLWQEMYANVDQYRLLEVIITALGMTGAVLLLLCQTRRAAPKVALALMLMLAAIATKALAHAVLFAPDDAFSWLTPAAIGGLMVGTVMLAGLSFAPPAAQRRAATLSLLIALVLINMAPSNPYFLSTLQEWTQGKFLNFNGAAQLLSLCWPAFALWFLTHPAHRNSAKSS
jgi:VanZ family protein